jgi:hypothetical protein
MAENAASGGPEKFKLLYEAMAADEVFSQVVPDNFDSFVDQYKDPNKLKTLYEALKADEVFSQVVPSDINQAMVEYGLGKPSPTPPSASGLGTQKNVGQTPMVPQEPSMSSPSSAQDLDFGFKKVVEEIENPEPMQQPVAETQVEETSLGEDLYSSLLRGSARLGQGIANTPAFIYDIAAMPQNYIAEEFDIPSLKVSSEGTGELLGIEENKVADFYRNQVEQSQKKFQSKYDKGITDYFSDGEYQKGFGLLANQIVESAPVTISLMMGNAAGVGTAGSITGSGLVFGAEKKDQLDREAPWMTEEQKINAALMYGLSEGIFEQFGLTKIGGVVKDVFLKSGKEAAEKIAKEGFKTTYGKILRQYFGTMTEEALSEAATQFTQNAIAKYSGEKPDQDLFEGVADAFIVGMGASSVYGAAPAIVQTAKTKSGLKKQQEISQKKDQITQSIESPDLMPAAKGALAQELKKLNEEEADLLIQETEMFDQLPEEKKAEVNNLEIQADEIAQSIQSPELTPEAKAVLEQSLGSIETQKDQILSEAKPKVEEVAVVEEAQFETPSIEAQVAEIKSKPLTRIEGAGMGSNQAVGTFVSTEPENRYAAQFPDAEVQQMEVDIENPFVTEDTNLIDYRNEMINRRKGELDETDFTEVEIPSGEFTIDDLSDSGIEKVAAMVTEEMKAKGYDSIYFPQVGAQEGELVVFDREKVRRKGEAMPAAKETKVEYKKPKSISVYLSIPNKDGSFNKSSERTSFVDGASIYALEPIGNNRFNVYIAENANASKMALQFSQNNISPIFSNIDEDFSPEQIMNAKSLDVITPSVVELQGDKYVLISEGRLDVDNKLKNKPTPAATAQTTTTKQTSTTKTQNKQTTESLSKEIADKKSDIERKRQEELSVEEHKPKNTIGYLPIPNKDGSFSAKSFSKTPDETSSMFQVEDLGNDRISVSFWNNNRAVQDATSAPELILNPIVRLKDALNQNTNKITTTKPAIFKKQGDKYVLEQMAEMYYSKPTKSNKEILQINAIYDAEIQAVEKLLTPQQDATQTRNQQQSNQQQREGATGQQQGQQENRANQEGNVAQGEAEAGGGNRVAEGGTEQEVTGTYGNEGEVKFADGVILNHKFKLIEADDMQPSHLVSGQRNPKHLIALAQPKERNDQGSRVQQDKIADNPRLQEVGDSPIAYTGAPIVNKRGEVIQGNNRSLGLKKHYDINGTSYKQQLAENAEKFGLTKEQVMAMKNPILVREVAASDQSAIVLGNYDVKDIETGGKQRIDPIVTSRKIKPSDRQKLTTLVFDGDKTVKEAIRDSAREIATIVKSYINPAQMKTAFSSSGEITASGMDDIEGIMNSFLYEDGPASLPEVFSSLPNVVQKGVQKGIPSLVSVDPEKSLLKDVQNAMTAAYEYIQSGADNFDVWSRSVDMFLGVSPQELFSPLELDLANKMLTAKKQSDIANIFKQYQANVTDQPAGLFDEAVPGLSKKDAIAKQFNLEYNETNDIKGTGADRVAPALRQEGQPNEPAEIGIAAEEEVNVEVEQAEAPASEGEGEAVELPTDEQREEIEEDGFAMPTDEEMAAKREQIQTDLQKAIQDVKDRFGDLFNQNMGIIYDPKVEARKLYNFHVSLVNLAKQAIRSGVTTAADFAKLIGKRLDKFTERAFNDAMNDINGLPMIINSEEQMLNAEYQRVAESYAKQREDAKALRKPFLKRFVENANSGWFDVNYVAKKMLADVGGFEAIKFKNLLGGASAKAKMQYENFKREIFGGLNSVEKKLLNDIIQARTVISIDSRYDAKGEPRIKHPGDTNKESQTVFLGLEESANPKQFEKLNERADKYFDAQRELLDERLKEGRISIEQYQGMIDNDYSPRVFLEYLIDDVESGSGLASGGGKNVGKSDIKSLSDGDVNSLFHNAEWLLATNVLSTSRSIFHNRANRSLYELAKADPNNGFIEIQQPNGINKETGQPTYKDPKSDQRQIQFFENGVRKSMLGTREFGESWNNNNPLLSPQYANAIRLASGGVYKRLFATGVNPLFALANFPRDIAHALFFTNAYSPTFPIALAQISTDLVRTAKDSWKFNRNKDKNGRYYNYVMQGGGMDFLATQGLPFEQQALIQSSAKDAMDATLKVVGYTNNSSEIWVRLAIRDREINKSTAKFARDNGRMPNESEREVIETNATEVARSQMDFSKGGRWSKAMDNLIPYLNPSLVALGTSFKYVRENPKIFAYKVAQALAISAALAAYNMRFKDDYDDIDDEEKNRNMIIMLDFFKTVDGKKRRAYIRIPKNQSSQWIFAMGEMMGETMESKEFRTRKGMSTLQTLMPPYDPRNIPIIDALNTYETGYDRFREKYVYDKDYKGEEWAEYYEGKTPWLWRDLGEQLGLSPVRLKAAVGKYTADPDNNMIWIAVTEAYDKLIKSVPEDEQKAVNDMAIESIEQLLTPVQRKFLGYTDPNSKAKSIRELAEKEETKIKLQNDTVKTFARKYINDEVSEAEVRSDFGQWLATQPKDSVNVKRLKSRFENSIRFKDIDNVFYRMTEADIPVVKAAILYEYYKGLKTDNEREVLLFQAKNAPNVPKDTKSDFWKEFNRLKANGEE